MLRFRCVVEQGLRIAALPSFQMGGQRIDAPPLETHSRLAGTLILRVYDEQTAGWTVGFEMEDVEIVESGADGTKKRDDKNGAAMAGEVLAHLDRRGGITRLVLPETTTPDARAFWKDLLAHWRLVHPEDESAEVWETVEKDVTGTCRVRYERRPPAIVKRKLEYTELATQSDVEVETTCRIEGETRFVLDPLPRLIEGRERLHLEVRQAGHSIDSELAFQYVRAAHARDSDLEQLAAARNDTLLKATATTLDSSDDLMPVYDPAETRRQLRDKLLALDLLLAAGKGKSVETHNLTTEIVELLKRTPAAAEEVMQRLHHASCGDRLASILTSCLGAAGTGPAQEGLRELLENGGTTDRRRRMTLYALAQVKEPIEGLDAALVRLRESNERLARPAFLVLAALGGRLRDRDPARYARIRTYVESGLRPDLDERELAHILNAFSNLGAGEVPAAVARGLGHESRHVRTAAASSLVRVDDPGADRLLGQLLREDSSPYVRKEALRTLLRRHEAGRCQGIDIESLLKAAMQDPARAVRDLARQIARGA
jgi:hypothetical protein